MIKSITILAIILAHNCLLSQITFCGNKTFPALTFSDDAQHKLEKDVSDARNIYLKDIKNADAIIWYGRRKAYLGLYDDAIKLYTEGIILHPNDARMYRHRGHRYLTTRCYDKAISDFTKAATLIKNNKDQIEPDGMPNAKNIPTSTLQSNIWYHLGLVYYLKKDFKKAERAYKKCLKVSTNPDMYVATVNWYYITLLELNKSKEAEALLNTIRKDMPLIENEEYLTILMLYKNVEGGDQVRQKLLTDNNTLKSATTRFGLANYYRLKGDKIKAKELMKKVTDGSQWGSFAYMAAEIWSE